MVQNDWFAESPEVKLKIDPDRANLAGITNRDVAASTTAAMSGTARDYAARRRTSRSP